MKALFFFFCYLFKLYGIKTMPALSKRFGKPDMSIPQNATKEVWVNALQNACKEKGLNFESISCNFATEKAPTEKCPQGSKIVFFHTWFLWPYKIVMTAVEYDNRQPETTLMMLKDRMKDYYL